MFNLKVARVVVRRHAKGMPPLNRAYHRIAPCPDAGYHGIANVLVHRVPCDGKLLCGALPRCRWLLLQSGPGMGLWLLDPPRRFVRDGVKLVCDGTLQLALKEREPFVVRYSDGRDDAV